MLDAEITTKLINEGGIFYNGEFVFLPLRLTGTGIAERIDETGDVVGKGLAYSIDRRMEDFSTPEWMSQYSNIPILLTHPKNEEGENVKADLENGCYIGNSTGAFIKGNEIWVIARIHDKEAVELILDRTNNNLNISTSPHFTSKNIPQEGSEIFLEYPLKINHLAIVERGFWDKKSHSPAIDVGGGDISLKGEKTEMSQELNKSDSVVERDVTSENKADESIEERVGNLENNEAQEAKEFEKLAKDHKELEKGDESVDKRELIREILAIAEKPNSDFKGGEDEKFNTLLGLLEKDSYNNSESGKSDNEDTKEEVVDEVVKEEIKEELEKDDDLVVGDYCDEDRKREAVIKQMHSLSDYAKAPFINGRVKAWKAQKEFAKSNLDLVDSKYVGMIDKIDSSLSDLSNEMFDSIVRNIEAKKAQEAKNASSFGRGIFSGKFKNR